MGSDPRGSSRKSISMAEWSIDAFKPFEYPYDNLSLVP